MFYNAVATILGLIIIALICAAIYFMRFPPSSPEMPYTITVSYRIHYPSTVQDKTVSVYCMYDDSKPEIYAYKGSNKIVVYDRRMISITDDMIAPLEILSWHIDPN